MTARIGSRRMSNLRQRARSAWWSSTHAVSWVVPTALTWLSNLSDSRLDASPTSFAEPSSRCGLLAMAVRRAGWMRTSLDVCSSVVSERRSSKITHVCPLHPVSKDTPCREITAVPLALAGYICPVSPRLSERSRRMVIGCLSVQLLRGVAVQMGRFERREDGADPAETCLFCMASIV